MTSSKFTLPHNYMKLNKYLLLAPNLPHRKGQTRYRFGRREELYGICDLARLPICAASLSGKH